MGPFGALVRTEPPRRSADILLNLCLPHLPTELLSPQIIALSFPLSRIGHLLFTL